MSSSKLKLLVDTDCGVDDAMALLLALSSSRGHVVGVTCCAGNTTLDNVCDNVKRVLVVCKKTGIPIYRGSNGPLLTRKRRIVKVYHAEDGLGGAAHRFPTGELVEASAPAAMALVELTRSHPGELTLVALGPLTNVAMAHRIDPEFTRRLKAIVCMGGNYKGLGNTTEVSEFNFYFDPEAADMVLGEALCPITLVPWETCLNFGLKLSLYDKQIQAPTAKGRFYKKITSKMLERAKARGRDFTTDCDLLAVAAALYPEAITSTVESPLAVECGGTYSRGLTILLNEESLKEQDRQGCKVKIVTGLDIDVLDLLRYDMLNNGLL
ncbi:hypothetical protein JTE90_024611 [Oedothorax gibbosus]|uniref:Inosine/uridine-preferring nucleoside hydrolase domain-containing protein n=1 Tax=Oedothorax gibbosus TaxID=931172 RepID=A0AAV6UGI6_9ARAC|nr:hypothetical protein JTE90_024611 [Oedothorax gibbosus]